MKKILSLVLALTLVLSTMSMAFADTAFPDIDADDDQLAEAAGLLNSLGVLAGDENGNYNPEDPLTREAMAKVVVHLLGYTEDDYVGYGNDFTDAQNMWSSDVIGLAADSGIVNGYGDGIFAPKDDVTYLQAAIMLIRALGYTDASLNNGVEAFNAGAYRSKALQLGLFNGVAPAWNEPATRGDLAVMSYNNLNNQLVIVNADQEAVGVEDSSDNAISLLSKTAEVSTETSDAITPEEVMYATTDISMYVYQIVDGYYVTIENEDGDDVRSFVYVNESLSDTVTDTVESAANGTNSTTIVIDVDGDDDFTDEGDTFTNVVAPVFFNGAEVDYVDAYAELIGESVTIVSHEDTNNNVVVDGIIANVETDRFQVEDEYETDEDTFEGVSLPMNDDDEVDFDNIMVTGDADDLYEIEADDIVEVYESHADSEVEMVEFVVTRNSVEGTITRKNSDGDVIIDTVGEYEGQSLLDSTILEVGDEGTFYYDSYGTIVAFTTEDDDTAVADYMVVTDLVGGVTSTVGGSIVIEGKITLLDGEGTSMTYAVDADATIDGDDTKSPYGANAGFDANEIKVGSIVESYTVDDDMITDIVVTTVAVGTTTNEGATDSSIFDAYVADDAVVFELDTTDNTYTARTLDQLITAALDDTEFDVVEDADGMYVVIIATTALTTDSTEYAYVATSEGVLEDGTAVQELVVYIDGVKETYLTDDDSVFTADDYSNGLYTFTMSGDVVTAVTAVSKADPTEYADISGVTTLSAIGSSTTVFKVDDTDTYALADDATIYIVDDGESVTIGDLADLEKDMNDTSEYLSIELYLVDGEVVTVIAVLN